MFNRFRGKRGKDGVAPQAKEGAANQGEDVEDSSKADDAEGFLCPMCMASMPGPAELQVHFEVAHSSPSILAADAENNESSTTTDNTDGIESPIPQPAVAPLIDLEPEPTDSIKESNSMSTGSVSDATMSAEVSLLQQELTDMAANLKEEKWYSTQLKKEHNEMRTERDQLEEEKAMIEEEYRSKLASAESGFLQVVEENTRLKQDLTYADYKTQKERHSKLTAQIEDLQEKLETELIIKTSLQEALDGAEVPLNEKDLQIIDLQTQLRERPGTDDVVRLTNELSELKANMATVSADKDNQSKEENRKWESSINSLNGEITSLQLKVKELEIEKSSKEDQLESLQSALASSTDNTKVWQQQQMELQKQLIGLQHSHSEAQASLKEKEALLGMTETQLHDIKEALKTEIGEKQDLAKQLSAQQKSTDEVRRTISNKDEELLNSAKQMDGLKDDMKRLELERSDLLQKIETGEGVQTAIQQLQQEKDKLVSGVAELQKENAVQVQKYELMSEESRKKIDELSENLRTEKEDCKHLKDIEKSLSSDVSAWTSKYELSKAEHKMQSQALCDMEMRSATERTTLQQEIENLKSSLLEKETKNSQIEQQLATVAANLQTESELRATSDAAVKTKDSNINNLSERAISLETELKTRSDELAKSTEEQNSRISTLETQLEVTTEALKAAEGEAIQKQSEIDSLKSQHASTGEGHAQEINTLQETVMSLKMSLEEMSRGKEDSDSTLLELRARQTTLEEDLAKQQMTFMESTKAAQEQNEKEKQEMLLQVETLKASVNQSEEARNTSSATVDSLNDTIASLEEQKKAFISTLEQKDEILRDMQSKLEVADLELKKQCESCENYEIQLCRLEEQHKDEFAMITKLKSSMEEKTAELETSNKTLLEEREKLTASSVEWSKEKDGMQTAMEELSEVKAILEARVLELDDELKEAYNKFGLAKNEKEFLITKLDSQEESKSLLLEELRFLETTNGELAVNITTLESQCNKQTEAAATKEQEMTSRVEDLESSIEQLDSKLSKEREDHEHTKSSFLTIQNALQEEVGALQQKMKVEKETFAATLKTRDNRAAQYDNQISALQDVEKKCLERISHKDVTIKSLDNRIDILEKEKDEVKGDVKVLEAQLQNAADEKRNMLERLLRAEEQGKKSKEKLSETNRRLDQALAALQELGQENQNLQVKHNLKLSRQWEDDSKVANCKKCDQLFSVTVRKHHCRQCGSIFCNECSAKTIPTPSSKKPVRVCDQCFNELGAFHQRRLSSASLR